MGERIPKPQSDEYRKKSWAKEGQLGSERRNELSYEEELARGGLLPQEQTPRIDLDARREAAEKKKNEVPAIEISDAERERLKAVGKMTLDNRAPIQRRGLNKSSKRSDRLGLA